MGAKRKINLSIDEDVIKAAKHRAIEDGTSISAEVEKYLRGWAGEGPAIPSGMRVEGNGEMPDKEAREGKR